MTLNDYIQADYPDYPNSDIEGFTIKNGKKVYWYITPMPKSGLYRCLPVEKDKTLGWPRYISGDTEINVILK